jgi:hypothetical protein
MASTGGSGEGWEDWRVEVKGNRPFIGDREVRRGSEPPTRKSPSYQVAGTGPALAGVRAQGEAADGPVDAMRAAGRRVWAQHAAGTGPNAPWRVRPRDHASTDAEGGGAAQPGARGRSGVSPSRCRGATTVNLTGLV